VVGPFGPDRQGAQSVPQSRERRIVGAHGGTDNRISWPKRWPVSPRTPFPSNGSPWPAEGVDHEPNIALIDRAFAYTRLLGAAFEPASNRYLW